jgi:hypothetical protein
VRLHRSGGKQLHHPVAGDLELTYEALELPANSGLTMITYTAEPGSASQEALDFLASWAATREKDEFRRWSSASKPRCSTSRPPPIRSSPLAWQ